MTLIRSTAKCRFIPKTFALFCTLVLFGATLLIASGLEAAEPDRFSPACDKIRTEAVRAYWKDNVEPKTAARMTLILASATSDEMSLLLLGEVFSGRINVKQLGDSSLAGFEAVDASPSCSETDRKSADQFRALLPGALSALAKKVSEMSSNPQRDP